MLKELTITIHGRPCSKKNSRQARTMRNPRTHQLYSFTVPGESYEAFRRDAISQLQIVRRGEKFGGVPVYIEYQFYKRGMGLQDVDNAIASINDVLQDKYVRIIDDDKQIMSGRFEIIPGNTFWKSTIKIRQLYCNPGEHDIEIIDDELKLCKVCNLTPDLIKALGA